VLRVMEAPELPRAILASKTADDSLAAWMFENKVGAVVYDVVDYDPGAVEVFLGRSNSCLRGLCFRDAAQACRRF
jgi:hypothetical protein